MTGAAQAIARIRWAALVMPRPSALLRGDPDERESAFKQRVGDLRVAASVLKAH